MGIGCSATDNQYTTGVWEENNKLESAAVYGETSLERNQVCFDVGKDWVYLHG